MITYANRNLLTRIVTGDGTVIVYRYNSEGQRIYKKVGSQAAEYYLMDGDQTVAIYENESLSQSDPFGKILEHSRQRRGGQAGCCRE